MRFPNAFSGIKKILASQYLQIISLLCLVVGAAFAIVGAGESSSSLLLTGGGIAIGAAIIGIIALILNLVGLNAARKDEKQFWTAFTFAILAILAEVISAILTSIYPDVADWLGFCSTLFELAVLEFSVSGIINLAENLKREDVAQFGRFLRTLIMILWIVVLVIRFFGNRIDRISNIMDIISSILELVVFVAYIILLTKAKKMLQKN